jgi:hypothetical protein
MRSKHGKVYLSQNHEQSASVKLYPLCKRRLGIYWPEEHRYLSAEPQPEFDALFDPAVPHHG